VGALYRGSYFEICIVRTFERPMLQKMAHRVEGLKSVFEPALKAVLPRMYLINASLVGGVVGFIVIVFCLVTGPIVYTVRALVRKLRRSAQRRIAQNAL
jgi:hypothetical protein